MILTDNDTGLNPSIQHCLKPPPVRRSSPEMVQFKKVHIEVGPRRPQVQRTVVVKSFLHQKSAAYQVADGTAQSQSFLDSTLIRQQKSLCSRHRSRGTIRHHLFSCVPGPRVVVDQSLVHGHQCPVSRLPRPALLNEACLS